MEDIKKTFYLMFKPRMLLCQPLIIWSGISMAIFGSVFISLMTRAMENSSIDYPELADPENDTGRNQTALLTMVFLGVGEILGGQIIGSIKDKQGVRIATLFEIGLLLLGTIIVLVFNYLNEFGFLAYLMCLVWGL